MWGYFTETVYVLIGLYFVRAAWRADIRAAQQKLIERADSEHAATLRDEHIVTRLNDYYYRCNCGQAGSERWATAHQFSFPAAAASHDRAP